MPHVLREDHRVILFRKWAASEKTLNGSGSSSLEDIPSSSTLITIHRSRIVEDGYAQLATLTPNALKGTIRVRFQNEFGLDEAGIDQDGVFKGWAGPSSYQILDQISVNCILNYHFYLQNSWKKLSTKCLIRLWIYFGLQMKICCILLQCPFFMRIISSFLSLSERCWAKPCLKYNI